LTVCTNRPSAARTRKLNPRRLNTRSAVS